MLPHFRASATKANGQQSPVISIDHNESDNRSLIYSTITKVSKKYQKYLLFFSFSFFFFYFFSFFVLIGESLDLQSNAWMKSAGWRALGRHKQTQKCGIKVIDAARVLFNKWIATSRRSGGRDSIAHVKDQWIWSDRWMDRLRRDESCPCTGLRTNKSHYLPPWPTFSYFSRREQVFNKPIGHVLVI